MGQWVRLGGGGFPTLRIYKDVIGVELKRISAKISVVTLVNDDGDSHWLGDLLRHGGVRLI